MRIVRRPSYMDYAVGALFELWNQAEKELLSVNRAIELAESRVNAIVEGNEFYFKRKNELILKIEAIQSTIFQKQHEFYRNEKNSLAKVGMQLIKEKAKRKDIYRQLFTFLAISESAEFQFLPKDILENTLDCLTLDDLTLIGEYSPNKILKSYSQTLIDDAYTLTLEDFAFLAKKVYDDTDGEVCITTPDELNSYYSTSHQPPQITSYQFSKHRTNLNMKEGRK